MHHTCYITHMFVFAYMTSITKLFIGYLDYSTFSLNVFLGNGRLDISSKWRDWLFLLHGNMLACVFHLSTNSFGLIREEIFFLKKVIFILTSLIKLFKIHFESVSKSIKLLHFESVWKSCFEWLLNTLIFSKMTYFQN